MSAPEPKCTDLNSSVPDIAGNLTEVPSELNQQTGEARAYIEELLSKRTQLVYAIGNLVAKTVIMIERRLWDLWSEGNPVTVLESVAWKDEIDKNLLSKILKLKRGTKEVLAQQEMAIIVAAMLENYFNRLYNRLLHNEVIAELQPLQQLIDYSSFTLLFLVGHQSANVHLAVNRLDLNPRSWQHYQKSLAGQLNTLINNRTAAIEQEVCTVADNWSITTMQGEKPFSFDVSIERETK
jgi:hypothetical protein